jgi:O-antigen ligase
MMAFDIFTQNPILGTGLDTMRVSLLGNNLHSHNTFIELLASLGPIGFTLYYSIHFFLIKKSLEVKDKWLRRYLLFFIFILLVRDLAGISYNNKFIIFFFIFFSYIAEERKITTDN